MRPLSQRPLLCRLPPGGAVVIRLPCILLALLLAGCQGEQAGVVRGVNLILDASHGGGGAAWGLAECGSCHALAVIHENADEIAPLVRRHGYATCTGCHGEDAKGMTFMGSANLTDGIYRFMPGGMESVKYTITHGVNDGSDPQTRNAVMPSFAAKLNDAEIKKLAVYVHQLGGGQ